MAEIEDRNKADEPLRASEKRLALLVSAANIGWWEWDLVTDKVFFSREWKSRSAMTNRRTIKC